MGQKGRSLREAFIEAARMILRATTLESGRGVVQAEVDDPELHGEGVFLLDQILRKLSQRSTTANYPD